MSRKQLNLIDSNALVSLFGQRNQPTRDPETTYNTWVRIVRTYLRMTQAELAKRAKVGRSHLVAIERGQIDPQLGTLRRIFGAMSCEIALRPVPTKPLEQVLRGRARSVALKRLKQTMGTMALEKQQPDRELFKKLLEKRTDEILQENRGRLWVGEDE